MEAKSRHPLRSVRLNWGYQLCSLHPHLVTGASSLKREDQEYKNQESGLPPSSFPPTRHGMDLCILPSHMFFPSHFPYIIITDVRGKKRERRGGDTPIHPSTLTPAVTSDKHPSL